MVEEEHECSQKVTLNTICIKLDNIEKNVFTSLQQSTNAVNRTLT